MKKIAVHLTNLFFFMAIIAAPLSLYLSTFFKPGDWRRGLFVIIFSVDSLPVGLSLFWFGLRHINITNRLGEIYLNNLKIVWFIFVPLLLLSISIIEYII